MSLPKPEPPRIELGIQGHTRCMVNHASLLDIGRLACFQAISTKGNCILLSIVYFMRLSDIVASYFYEMYLLTTGLL